MRRTIVTTVASVFAFMASVPASGQRVRDAMDLLNKVKETYGSLKRFQFDGISILESHKPGEHTRLEFPFEIAFEPPNKMRVENKSALFPILFVSDGKIMWCYGKSARTYSRIDLKTIPGVAPQDPIEGREFVGTTAAAASILMVVFQSGIADHVKQATILGEEDVEVQGTKTACYIVQVDIDPTDPETKFLPASKTYWIDKGRFVVLRESSQSHDEAGKFGPAHDFTLTSSITSFKLNEPLPEDLFIFTPPEGAKETEGNTTPPAVPAHRE